VRLRPGTSAPSKVPGATGQLALVESSVEVPVELVTAGGDRGGALLRLQFGPLGERQESALIELIYNGSAWYQKPRRVGTLDALLILIGSVWKIVPAQPQGKMDPH